MFGEKDWCVVETSEFPGRQPVAKVVESDLSRRRANWHVGEWQAVSDRNRVMVGRLTTQTLPVVTYTAERAGSLPGRGGGR